MALSTVLGAGTFVTLTTGILAPAPPAGASTSGSSVYVGNITSGTISSFAIPTPGGNIKPSATVTTSDAAFPYQLAFDANGDLWSANTDRDTVSEYSPTALEDGGSQSAEVTIGSHEADGLAFNAAGDLWVGHYETDMLTEYTATQLETSGTPTPAVVITSDGLTPPSLEGTENLAIDAAGDLWVTNEFSSTVVEYTATQLKASGDPTPAVTISSEDTSLASPSGIAFDARGDLWVSNDDGADSLVKYTPAQLTTSGDPTPAVTLDAGVGSLWGIGFDSSGDLWAIAAFTHDAVLRYSPAQLAEGGTLAPLATISGTKTGLDGPVGLAVKAPPTVTSLSPVTGLDSGGTTVTVHGTGFTSSTSVDFGTAAATTVKVVSPFELTAVSPPGEHSVTVTVTTFAGTSATSIGNVFTYRATGYDLVGSDGGVFVFDAPGQIGGFYGSLPGIHVVPNLPVVGMVPTVFDTGYFLVAQDGGVFAFTAPFLGSLPGIHVAPKAPIEGIAAADTDKGYYLVGKDGGVFAFGTVPFLGSLPGNGISVDNIIGIAATPSGNGYWLVSQTGTVYAFGSAGHFGTAKGTSSPVSAIAGTPTGGGYWITTKNGTVYPFGNAKSFSTLPAERVTPALPVIGIAHTDGTGGYWLLGSDGGIFAFGNAPFYGSLPGLNIHVTNIVGAVSN